MGCNLKSHLYLLYLHHWKGSYWCKWGSKLYIHTCTSLLLGHFLQAWQIPPAMHPAYTRVCSLRLVSTTPHLMRKCSWMLPNTNPITIAGLVGNSWSVYPRNLHNSIYYVWKCAQKGLLAYSNWKLKTRAHWSIIFTIYHVLDPHLGHAQLRIMHLPTRWSPSPLPRSHAHVSLSTTTDHKNNDVTTLILHTNRSSINMPSSGYLCAIHSLLR